MAVVYFTSNASTGVGSLAEAVKNAQPGDVIQPDETVFERGSTIEIVLAATLTVDKNLTLDSGPFCVRLNGGGARRCAIVSANVTATFIGFDFVLGDAASSNGGGLNGASTTDVTCIRCGFYGCGGASGGGAYLTGVSVLRDCAVIGCRATTSGGGIYFAKSPTLNGVTVAGCVAPVGSDVRFVNATVDASNSILCDVVSSNNQTYHDCVVNVALSQIGFVAPPPDDLSVDDWDANAWQNWDLHLLDDASGAPSPYRDSGDVGAASKYDFEGNFRGRETNGVATCSPGAYETIQADLFWIGVDANGAEVVSPSFLTSDGWAASRFATVSGDVAPQAGQTLFIDGEAVFVDTPTQDSSLNIGGYAVVSTGTGGAESIVSTIGFGATFAISMSVILQRLGGLVEFNWTSGNVTVNTDITMSKLSIPSLASITVNGAFVSIETLRVSDSSTVAFSGADAILAATETATVGAATFTGTGYFATPPGTDTSSASFTATVRACDYGANVSSFNVSRTSASSATLSWVKQNPTPSVLLEKANGSNWDVVDNKATGDSFVASVGAAATFRLFDGESFFTSSVSSYETAYELAEEQTIGYLKTLISVGYLN